MCKRHFGNSNCEKLFAVVPASNCGRKRTVASTDRNCAISVSENVPEGHSFTAAAAMTDRHHGSSTLQNWTCRLSRVAGREIVC